MNSNTYFRQHPRKGICGKKDVTFSETEDTLTLSVATKTETEDVVVTLTDPSTLTIQFRRKNVDIRQILEKRDGICIASLHKTHSCSPQPLSTGRGTGDHREDNSSPNPSRDH